MPEFTQVRDRTLQQLSRLRGLACDWLRDWRRARVAKRKIRSRQVYALLASLLVLGAVFGWSVSYLAPSSAGQRLSIDQLGAIAAHGQLVTASFHDEDARIVGTFRCAPVPSAPQTTGSATSTGAGGSASPQLTGPTASAPTCSTAVLTPVPFWVSYPKSDAATAVLLSVTADSGAHVTVDPQTRKAEIRLVTTLLLPLMILVNLFVLLLAGGKGNKSSGIGEVETFGSIGKGRFGRKRNNPVTFADVAGADKAVEELKEVRDYLADPSRYQLIGAQPPRGVLLIGPPGCGKTLLAKAVAGEVGVPFFSVAGAEFVESLVGVGAARVRDLFARVRSVAPAVVFIDELDAAGRKRASGGGSGGNEEREQTLNQILVEMDGFDVSSGIVVMAATNRPDILDPALLRPGRFDRHVTVDRPDLIGRMQILELHARNKPLAFGVDLGYVARRTPGFSGADLANVINEAALLAVRQGKAEIDTSDLEEGVHRALSGTVRRGQTLTPEERKRAAVHESGHVIVAAASGQIREIHRVSILMAGRNVGTTTMRGDEDAVLLTRRYLLARLTTHLAGMAAEELIFGDPSTGSEQDIERATALARDIVARYGMNDKLGPVRRLAPDVDGFLDADVPLDAVSGLKHQQIDEEIQQLLENAKRDALAALTNHRDAFADLAARLETAETLEGPDLEAFIGLVRPEAEMFGSVINSNGQPAAKTTGGKVRSGT